MAAPTLCVGAFFCAGPGLADRFPHTATHRRLIFKHLTFFNSLAVFIPLQSAIDIHILAGSTKLKMMRTKYFIVLLVLIFASCTTSEEKISRKAEKMHDAFLSIDTHSDTPMRFFRRGGFDPGVRSDQGCVDFPRMKELLKYPPIFDGRNQYSPSAMKSMGFEYVCVERG